MSEHHCPRGQSKAVLGAAKLDLSILLIQSKFFQLFFVLDIFGGILASDSTVGLFYAVFHCPFDNEIQRNHHSEQLR